jgi:iron complex outermembrane receptor protein
VSAYRSNPLRRHAGSVKLATLAALILAAWSAAARAENAAPFTLGTIVVTGTRLATDRIAEDQVASVITQKTMRQHDRNTVGEALNLLSGVSITRNTRNEQTVYLRGYDPRQVPLFIDGIPVYVPYDGYVDFDRFGTSDLAAIQVAKGFSSVAYGPNTLGGAINLVSRKPTRVLEGDASLGFGQDHARLASVNLGTRQELWYLQAAAGYRETDGFRLSADFRPTATEDGGQRNNAYAKDDRVSLKLGITPNGSDEYALTYIKQNGEKGNPPSTDPAAARYWQWPFWNKESAYFVSKTAIGRHEMVKVKLYQDKFDNSIRAYTNAEYNVLKTSGAGSVSSDGVSVYADQTRGGSVELESSRIAANTLRVVAHYKTDEHVSHEASGLVVERFKDSLVSYAVEDNIQLDPRFLLSLGLAQHELRPDSLYKLGSAYRLPSDKSTRNAQAGLFFNPDETTRYYATIAQKTRLPTLKDRYSARLGSYVENPSLQPEEALNYEIGYQGRPWQGARAEAALFSNDIEHKIQSINLNHAASCSTPNPCQMQNVGKARVQGIELGLEMAFDARWEMGANATWQDLKNISDPGTRLTGIPRNKLVLHGLWRPVAAVDLSAFAEHNSSRWASNTVQLAGYSTLNLKAAWHLRKDFSLAVGVNNLTDRNYEVDYGFPNPGRSWFANAYYQF